MVKVHGFKTFFKFFYGTVFSSFGTVTHSLGRYSYSQWRWQLFFPFQRVGTPKCTFSELILCLGYSYSHVIERFVFPFFKESMAKMHGFKTLFHVLEYSYSLVIEGLFSPLSESMAKVLGFKTFFPLFL
jgi:hypothetical protein